MKRIVMLSMLALSLVLGGCSQNSSSSAASGSKTETKTSDFPNKPIELVVPYAPGGGTDAVGRALASVVNKYLPNGQTVAIVNKPGGAGTIGITEVLNSKPDGYKIGLTTTGITSIQPHYGTTAFTHDSFQPVMRILSAPQVLFVRSDAPWKTYEEWLDYVKENPGKFTYGTGGSAPQIAMESLNEALGIETKNVPFEGAGPTITALLGGHVEGVVFQAQEAKAQIEEGSVRALINLGSSETEMKDLPLAKDKGVDIEQDVYTGIISPKGLPKEVLDILDEAFKKALEDPAVIDQFNKLGVQPMYASSEEFQKVMTDSFNRNGDIMRKIGLTN